MSRLGKGIALSLMSILTLPLVIACSSAPAAAPTAAPSKPAAGQPAATQAAAPAKALSGEPIKVGNAGPLTGPNAQQGELIKRAVEQAVAEINAKGGVMGRPLQLVIEDDKADPKEAVAVAQKMVNAGVVAVIGHWSSATSIPASVVYEEAKLPMISAASTNPQLTEQGQKFIFRTAGRTDKGVSLMDARYAYEVLNKRKVALLHDKSTFGQGLAEGFQAAFKQFGGEAVAFEAITVNEKDFSPVLTKFKGINPDVIFYGGYYPEAGQVAKQRRDLGLKATLMGAAELHQDQFLKIAGDGADGTVVAAGPDADLLPNAKAFMEGYAKKGPDAPTEWAMHGYDATYILADAITRAGSTDKQKLRDAIAATKGFQGLFGAISFDAKGDVVDDPNVIYTRQGDKWLVDAYREGKWVKVRQ